MWLRKFKKIIPERLGIYEAFRQLNAQIEQISSKLLPVRFDYSVRGRSYSVEVDDLSALRLKVPADTVNDATFVIGESKNRVILKGEHLLWNTLLNTFLSTSQAPLHIQEFYKMVFSVVGMGFLLWPGILRRRRGTGASDLVMTDDIIREAQDIAEAVYFSAKQQNKRLWDEEDVSTIPVTISSRVNTLTNDPVERQLWIYSIKGLILLLWQMEAISQIGQRLGQMRQSANATEAFRVLYNSSLQFEPPPLLTLIP